MNFRSKNHKTVLLWKLFFAFLMIFLSSCSAFRFPSKWRTRPVSINGNADEWRDGLYYLEDENFSLGIRNDTENIYVCMVAENRLMGYMVLSRGLTFWFDPGGGRNKVFGIRFPKGFPEDRPDRPSLSAEERRAILESAGRLSEEDREKFRRRFMKEAVILGPEKGDETHIPVEKLQSIIVKAKAATGLFVYELKVPLRPGEQAPYAVGVSPGQTIGIGIEIPKPDLSAMRNRRSGGRIGGGIPPGGRMGRRGPTPPGGFRRLSDLWNGVKVWMTVTLAEPSK